MSNKTTIKLNLLENSYDYLNNSIEFVIKARKSKDQFAWKFAIISIVQCIELMLKEKLRIEHELFIYANIDKYKPITREKPTVSWDVLIDRLHFILKDDFQNIDCGRLNLAKRLRNQMLHYEVELHFPEIYHEYANLLNFVVKFHEKYLERSLDYTLKEKIRPYLLEEEENLSAAFFTEIVYFNDIFISKLDKDAITAEQKKSHLVINGKSYKRITYGEEIKYFSFDLPNYPKEPCHDCLVIEGQYHVLGCDVERCPKCNKQLITCGCLDETAFDDND